MRLTSIPLKYKLPAIIVGLSLVVGVSLQVVNDMEFQTASADAAASQFEAVTQSIHSQIVDWYNQRAVIIRTTAASPDAMNAIDSLGKGLAEFPGGPDVLRKEYVQDNPNPKGSKQNYDRAPGLDSYSAEHASVNPWMRKVQELNKYYDIFLVDTHGTILYTVAKEDDYMSNLVNGPYAATGLGEVVGKALQGKPGDVFLSDIAPYAASNGDPAIFMATPVAKADGSPMGVLAFQLSQEKLDIIVNGSEGLGNTGNAYILGSDGKTRTPSRVAGEFAAFTAVVPSSQSKAAAAGQPGYFGNTVDFNGDPAVAAVAPLTDLGNGWSVVVEMDQAEIMAPANAMLHTTLMIGVALLLASLGLGFWFSRSVTKPISRVTDAVKMIADGDLDSDIVDVDRQDEVGDIAKSLDALRQKLGVAKEMEAEQQRQTQTQREVVDTLSQGLQDLATGDLSRPITKAFSDSYEGLRLDFNRTLDNLAETIRGVVDASQNIRSRSAEISAASEDLSKRTENQAAALEETAAALDEMTASTKSAADAAREVETIVRQARQEAEQSGVVVTSAVAAMSEIEKSSEQISQIIGAIDDIAFQTNLLALNAGVEAARAGDAGKGFAVVASEVRALAQRSSAAAKEIKSLIVASAQHVGRGVEQVGKAGEALHSIVGSVANISTLVSNIAAGAAEQSTGLAEINTGVTQLDQVTQQNAAMVEESTAASHSLNSDALGLADLVAKFNLGQQASAPARVVAMSQFVPTSFAGFEPKPAAAVERSPVKAAVGAAKVGWQDF